MRFTKLAMFAATTLALSFTGCSMPDGSSQREAEIRACGLQDDPTITADVTVHACAADNTKKTTVCHIPPGNPANAHTICVGNPSVPAHLAHGDAVGACPDEPPCGGGDVDAGTGDGSGSGSGSGSTDGGGDGSGSGSGSGSDGGVIL